MCRLFGFRSAVPSGAHQSLVRAENALSLQSTRHPDGWGIGWFVDDDAYVVKSQTSAHTCERFLRASERLTSHTFVVHVRRATVGTIDHLNAHPFRFGRWLFAHNGTIFGFDALSEWMLARTEPSLAQLILGDTDSEHLFYYLLSCLERAGADRTGHQAVDAHLVGSTIREALFQLDAEARRQDIERPITNVILTDGRAFIAHRAGMPLLMSTQKHHCADFETCPEPSKVCMLPERPVATPVNHVLVASEPIAATENRWEELDDGTTLALSADFTLRVYEPPTDWVAPELPERYRSSSSEAETVSSSASASTA